MTIEHFGNYSTFFLLKNKKITNKITLINENETVISKNQLISKELKQFFKNITKALNIRKKLYLIDESELPDAVNKSISKYRNHRSILLIKVKIRNPTTFSFNKASLSDIEKG